MSYVIERCEYCDKIIGNTIEGKSYINPHKCIFPLPQTTLITDGISKENES